MKRYKKLQYFNTSKQEPFAFQRDPKFYHSSEWRRCRKEHLSGQPLCVMCEAAGRLTAGNTVDHIIPINNVDAYDTQGGRYPHPLDKTNLQTLCRSCHSKKTARK
jgi:5-methylcytosine-specific restriction protein A